MVLTCMNASNYKHLYKSNRWKTISRNWLRLNPLCVFCGNPASVTDHKIPHKGDEQLFYARGNRQSLCKCCHDSTKKKIENGTPVVINNVSGDDGLPLSDDHPWNK